MCWPASACVGSHVGCCWAVLTSSIHCACVYFFIFLFVFFTGIARTLSRWVYYAAQCSSYFFYASVANALFLLFVSSWYFCSLFNILFKNYFEFLNDKEIFNITKKNKNKQNKKEEHNLTVCNRRISNYMRPTGVQMSINIRLSLGCQIYRCMCQLSQPMYTVVCLKQT